jgi:BNR repeat-like domain
MKLGLRTVCTAAITLGALALTAVWGGTAHMAGNDASQEDAALVAPLINTAPGPEYAGDLRLFQGIPGIERAANGRLWATWYGGGEGEGAYNYSMLVTSGDDGKTWTDLKMVIDPPGNVRSFDPCLWVDPEGKLWFFWAQGYSLWDGRSGVWAIVTDDPGVENPKWSEPRRICDGIMMNKPTVLSTGEWLLPAAIWAVTPVMHDDTTPFDITETTGSYVCCSTDQGKTWAMRGRADVKERACDEHMVVERNDGSLWMVVRTQYGLGESFSTDGGKTWTGDGPAETVTHIPHARFFIRRLASGKLLLVKHDPPNQKVRAHLKAFLSDDDGKTWYGGLMLDERAGVSYPDGFQSPDGTIYIIHDFQRTGAREILMCTFTEEDVAAGKPTTDKFRNGVVVNKASGKKAFKYSDNADGEALLDGPVAVIEPLEGETDTFKKGALLFSNRAGYRVLNRPKALDGKAFVRATIDHDAVVCKKAGVVYVLTPQPNRNNDSVTETLLKAGFKKTNVPEFMLFDNIQGNICSVYQKQMQQDEKLELGKWGVIVY